MIYMGSKNKIAKYIVPILQQAIDDNDVVTYIECFVGGANIIDKIHCKYRLGYDRSDTLIALLQQAADDYTLVLKEGTRELWDKGKAYVKNGIKPADMTLAEIGAIEFFGSYNNGGFPRGYAKNSETRNYYNEAYKNLQKQAPLLKDIVFKAQNYWELAPIKKAVIYLDPPYKDTVTYGYANQPKMDYTFFWNWVREISQHNFVFISEQQAPDDFKIVWKKQIKRSSSASNQYKATECLFTLDI